MVGRSTSLAGRVVDDRFRIEHKIGAGGMGDVYMARQLKIDRPVALKLMKPGRTGERSAVRQFLNEAIAVSKLKSPHTVTLHDVGQLEDGSPFLAMELLEGCTLRARLSEGPLPLDEVLEVVDAISLSLAEAHARGMVHRDLKPSNVFLAQTPGHRRQVKVLDFGLARLVSDDGPATAGTPHYMAPEALSGEAVDARSDVYALGLVAYELLAGRHPFEGLERDDVVCAQLSQVPTPLLEVSPHELRSAVGTLIARCLAKPPKLRPRDASAFRQMWRSAFGLPEESVVSEVSVSDRPRVSSSAGALTSQTVLSRTLAQFDIPMRKSWLLPLAAVAALGGVALIGLLSPEQSVSGADVDHAASSARPSPPAAAPASGVVHDAMSREDAQAPIAPTASSGVASNAPASPPPDRPAPTRTVRRPRVDPTAHKTSKGEAPDGAVEPTPAATATKHVPSVDERVKDYFDD